MRKKTPKAGELTEQILSELLTRVASLEDRVSALEGDASLAHQPSEPKQRGPKPRISDAYLLAYRDGLVLWIEEMWPELVPRIFVRNAKAETAAFLRSMLYPKGTMQGAPQSFETRLLENIDTLFDFIRSRFFRRKPLKSHVALIHPWTADMHCLRAAAQFPTRQIANAMAGVPELSWRTSLDRCTRAPCPWPVRSRTEEYFRKVFQMPPLPPSDPPPGGGQGR